MALKHDEHVKHHTSAWRVLENKRAEVMIMRELRGVEALAQIWKDELTRRIDYWQRRS
ncbi:hypothetical protein SAMN05660971_01006 [Halomonas cupida]|uniref:Uncharacterized protein n=1 Tax=Halomonas cupida TaxID=44933 RepID=A0A1M7C9N9_9GAMM|nr:hypothetical protein SAMN05660971_01006 [Halomonas cupida]